MIVLLWLGLASLFATLVLTPAFRELFRFCGFFDLPNQVRKIHTRPIPPAGGVAIAVSCIVSLSIIQLLTGKIGSQILLVWKILPSAAVVFVVGIIDDLWGLKHWQKLLGQLAAAGVACWSGIVALDMVGVHTHAWWSIPATILWLLTCTNAFNLVDGMDGLAAGVGLFATSTILVAALLQKNMALAVATAPLIGSLLGFLRYNFNPATVFLGDSGSLLLGFTLGCYGIIWTQKSVTLLGMTAPIMALSVPLFDVSMAVARRFLRTQSIFSADRGHIHHRLLDRGIPPRRAALLLYGLSSIVAVFSLLQSFSHSNQVASVIVIFFCAMAWMGIRYLEYAEFTLASRFLLRGDLQRAVKAQIDLDAFKREIINARDAAECNRIIGEAARSFGLRLGEAVIFGEMFAGDPMPSIKRWTVRVPLESGDFLEMDRENGALSAAGSFIEVLQSVLILKSRFFHESQFSRPRRASVPVLINPAPIDRLQN